MAQLSPILGFLIILKDSFKLIFKNVKLIAPIALLSLLISSTLVLIFTYIYQSLDNSINKIILSAHSVSSIFPIIPFLTLIIFLCRITFIITFLKIYQISGIATILVSSATSYTSYQDLYSRIKTAVSRSSSQFGFGGSNNRAILERVATTVWMFSFFTAFFSPNPITISIAGVVGISVSVFQLNASEFTHVVSIVEEKYEGGSEALERAEELLLLIEGSGHRQVHGFMINLFLNLLLLIIFLGFWLCLGTKLWSLNLTKFAFVLVNVMFVKKMYGCVAYTVLYFRCNKHCHGE